MQIRRPASRQCREAFTSQYSPLTNVKSSIAATEPVVLQQQTIMTSIPLTASFPSHDPGAPSLPIPLQYTLPSPSSSHPLLDLTRSSANLGIFQSAFACPRRLQTACPPPASPAAKSSGSLPPHRFLLPPVPAPLAPTIWTRQAWGSRGYIHLACAGGRNGRGSQVALRITDGSGVSFGESLGAGDPSLC